jgi:hypothetical protein
MSDYEVAARWDDSSLGRTWGQRVRVGQYKRVQEAEPIW